MARPTTYNQKFARAVLERLESGESLNSICRDPKMPGRKTVYRWIDKHEEFRHNYVRARELGAEAEFDDLDELAATATPETVQVVKLQVDVLKWKLARKFPKKYGERQQIDHSSEDGSMTPPTRIEIVAADGKSEG